MQLPNCRHLGAVDPDRLPDLYAAADIGIIPYKDLLVIRESGSALKGLEMLASGLPVVSTLMRPMVGLTDGLVVVDNATDFLETLGKLCRGALSQQAYAQMAALCQENDYDRKFEQVLGSLTRIFAPDAAPASHMGPFITECRTHLRLVEEAKRNLRIESGDAAVKCRNAIRRSSALTAELRYFRRFRRAARRLPGAEAFVRAVRLLRRPVR